MPRCASWCASLASETPLFRRSLGLAATTLWLWRRSDWTTERPFWLKEGQSLRELGLTQV
jgi:hypothetical protein